MPGIQPFSEGHIEPAVRLGNDTEHIGVSPPDDPVHLAAFPARNPGFSFVAAEDRELVGACPCGHDGRRGYIHHLWVARSHRRSCFGCKLLEKCLNALREAGVQKCHAFVFHANPCGELLWEPQGWARRDDLVVFSMYSR